MTETIFDKIIRGDIPAHKIYEDDKTLVILDINPLSNGHMLIISKQSVDKVYRLDVDYYQAMFDTVRKMAELTEATFGVRAGIVVEGLDVPHAHIHVVPMYDRNVLQLHHGYPVDKEDADLVKIADQLRQNL